MPHISRRWTLDLSEIKNYVVVSADSPTGLSWIKTTNRRIKVGTPALTGKLSNGYYGGRVNGVHFYAHRVVFYLTHGYWPKQVDHVNGVRDDNRPDNLREANHTTNAQNKLARGYYFDKDLQRYRVRVWVNGVAKECGTYKLESDARKAYLQAKQVAHPTAPERCYESS